VASSLSSIRLTEAVKASSLSSITASPSSKCQQLNSKDDNTSYKLVANKSYSVEFPVLEITKSL